MKDIKNWCYRETTDVFEAYRDARARAYDASIRGAEDALHGPIQRPQRRHRPVACGDHGEAF